MTAPPKTFNLRVDGVTYAIEILQEASGRLEMRVNGHPHTVEIETALAVGPSLLPQSKGQSAPTAPPATPQTGLVNPALAAPMPGDITAVLVAPGDSVQAGDSLCVLEAMKMKNTLRAAQAGVVAQVHVQPGQVVRFGEVLVTFEGRK